MDDERELKNTDWLTELAGGELAGAELKRALSERFAEADEVERAAAEVLVARRVRSLMLSLREAEVEVPAGFEARLLERVRGDQTLLDMLEIYLNAFGVVIIELINALFSLLPSQPQGQRAAA